MSSAAKEYFKKAELAAKKGNFEYAIELFTQGLVLNPAASEERRKLHKIATLAIEEQGGNPQGGLKAKLKLAPILANAKKLSMQKKTTEVIIEYEKALRVAPQNAQVLFNLAEALETGDQVEASMSTLEEVLEFDKTNIEAHRKLGRQWAERDDPEKAITHWEKVRQYRPDDKEAGKAIRDLSAATMVKKTEERKAAAGDDSFTAVLKSEDESAELEKKSKIIRNDDDRREAIGWKKDELRKDPENSRLWRELGNLYQDLKQWKYAEAAFKKALDVNPHDMFVKEKLGVLRESRMKFELDSLKTKLGGAEGNGGEGLEALRAQLAAKEKEFAKFMVEEYARRVKEHPTDQGLKLEYGQVLLEAGQHDDAIGQFQQAVKDPKLKVPAFNLIGRCFEAKTLFDLAEAQYRQALDGAPPDSDAAKDIKYNLGVVAEKKGDKDAALQWYQDLMAVDITFRDVSARVTKLMAAG